MHNSVNEYETVLHELTCSDTAVGKDAVLHDSKSLKSNIL